LIAEVGLVDPKGSSGGLELCIVADGDDAIGNKGSAVEGIEAVVGSASPEIEVGRDLMYAAVLCESAGAKVTDDGLVGGKGSMVEGVGAGGRTVFPETELRRHVVISVVVGESTDAALADNGAVTGKGAVLQIVSAYAEDIVSQHEGTGDRMGTAAVCKRGLARVADGLVAMDR